MKLKQMIDKCGGQQKVLIVAPNIVAMMTGTTGIIEIDARGSILVTYTDRTTEARQAAETYLQTEVQDLDFMHLVSFVQAGR
jgi:hypothetical protein